MRNTLTRQQRAEKALDWCWEKAFPWRLAAVFALLILVLALFIISLIASGLSAVFGDTNVWESMAFLWFWPAVRWLPELAPAIIAFSGAVYHFPNREKWYGQTVDATLMIPTILFGAWVIRQLYSFCLTLSGLEERYPIEAMYPLAPTAVWWATGTAIIGLAVNIAFRLYPKQ